MQNIRLVQIINKNKFTSKDALLQFGWDCLNISIYNPDEEMCMLFEKIATSEEMFWRKED